MKCVIVSIFLTAALSVSLLAQSADDHYHNAAQLYIAANLDRAIEEAEAGLAVDPSHAKLQALLEELRQKKEEQEQQQQQQQEQQQEQQQQQQQEGEQQEQQQEQQQQQQQEQEEQEQQQQEQQQQQQAGDPEDQEQQEAKPEPKPGEEKKELSKEDAERILQALRSKEKDNKKLRNIPVSGRKKRVEKDW